MNLLELKLLKAQLYPSDFRYVIHINININQDYSENN